MIHQNITPDISLCILQTLIENGLRERVILRVDGGLKSGVDVMMAAAIGADEYGFGSLAMIATGCVMARICHTNNCPVGVASQVYSGFLLEPFNHFNPPQLLSFLRFLSHVIILAGRVTCPVSWCAW